MNFLDKYFKISERGSNLRNEIIGGIVTFIASAYIIIVNPAILEAGGIPKAPAVTATILTAFIGTFLMGIYANRPFMIAPYMGENAFIAYTVCKTLGYSWQTALGAVFIGGVLFTLLTLLRLRSWLANSIPNSLKYAFSAGLGLFLCFIGLNEAGLINLGTESAPVKLGNLHSPQVLIAIFCLLIISFFIAKRIKGAILLGILTSFLLGVLFRVIEFPLQIVSLPPSLKPLFLKLDIIGALKWGFFSVILTLFIMDFVDTIGTLIGVGAIAGMLDNKGNFPDIEKPMLCDALSTCIGAVLGVTTSGTFIESAAGVKEGARTGLASIITSILFLLALFFSPILTVIPSYCYGPALVIVGILMTKAFKDINFKDPTEFIPAILVIIFMCFTYNIGVGVTAGFIIYVLIKLLTKRFEDLNLGILLLAGLSLLFFIFYPY